MLISIQFYEIKITESHHPLAHGFRRRAAPLNIRAPDQNIAPGPALPLDGPESQTRFPV